MLHCLYITLVLFLLPSSLAQAAAWVLPQGQAKISLSLSTFARTYPEAIRSRPGIISKIAQVNFSPRHIRSNRRQIFAEYGLHDQITGIVILSSSTLRLDATRTPAQAIALGIRVKADWAMGGLLPPYFYHGLHILFPNVDIRRDKRASLLLRRGLAEYKSNRNWEYMAGFALGDIVSFNRFNVFQETQLIRGWRSDGDWYEGFYRTQLGWDHKYWFGKEVFFYNKTSSYKNLLHQYYIDINVPQTNLNIKLTRGHQRDRSYPEQLKAYSIEWRLLF